MNKTITFADVAEQLEKYKTYLLSAPWFQAKSEETKTEWLEPLNEAQHAISSQNAVKMWEASIDHMFAADIEHDTGPEEWQRLYEMIDELRTELGVDSTMQPEPEYDLPRPF